MEIQHSEYILSSKYLEDLSRYTVYDGVGQADDYTMGNKLIFNSIGVLCILRYLCFFVQSAIRDAIWH